MAYSSFDRKLFQDFARVSNHDGRRIRLSVQNRKMAHQEYEEYVSKNFYHAGPTRILSPSIFTGKILVLKTGSTLHSPVTRSNR